MPLVRGLHELGKMFAPNGEIFDTDTVRGLMAIPELTGMKHSSLDRMQELERLSLRDSERPDFRIYTGNDLGINMIEYGSDYLLGLATHGCAATVAGQKRLFCLNRFVLMPAHRGLTTEPGLPQPGWLWARCSFCRAGHVKTMAKAWARGPVG